MKKLILLMSIVLIILLSFLIYKRTTTIETLNLNIDKSRDTIIESKFNKEYKISLKDYSNKRLDKEIRELSKKTTYLLLGNINESSEEYYLRHKSYSKLRYKNNNSKDIDNFIAEESTEYMFDMLNELEIDFSSIGDIKVTESKDLVISTVVVPDIILKTSTNNKIKYTKKKSNLILKYYFKKNNDKYQLYYLTSDYKNNLYSSEVSYAIKTNNINDIYNYKDLTNINDTVYEKNKNNIMKLTSYKINEEVSSSIGVLIDDSILLTTYNFIEKSLLDADFISIKTVNNSTVNYEGIITANKKYNYALIKLKGNNLSTTKIGKIPDIEEASLEVSNIDNEINTNKVLVIGNKNNIKTSIDNYNNSLLYDKNSNLIGLSINDEYINSKVLKAIKSTLNNKIATIDFNSLKEETAPENSTYKDRNIVLPKELLKYNIIKKIDKNINIPLVSYTKTSNNISLKYKNNINNYISNMNIFSSLKEDLADYKKIYSSSNKEIYQNSKYRIIAMSEFDYLIIIVVIL